jgi:hypothetical protein
MLSATTLLAAALLAQSTEEPPAGLLAPTPTVSDLLERIEALEQRLDQAERTARVREPKVHVHGYIDFGFFAPQPGNQGSGVIQDIAALNARFPALASKYGWVFFGDLYAPMVNSRGEPADLGNLPGAQRFDSIHSGGAPGFIVNEATLLLDVTLLPNLTGLVGINFVPRSGANFAFGDFFNVDVAQVEWVPFEAGHTSIFVGKFDSVLGIEYRERRASQRFGITPSLIQRYTSGTPLGVKVRTKLFDDLLVVALSLTNGTSVAEPFHFYSEIDTNWAKTGSGRVSIHPPLPGELDLEVGLSGLYGGQDLSHLSTGEVWFLGADARLAWRTLTVKAQWLRGFSRGSPSEGVYRLELNGGGYVEADWMIIPLVGVVARGEYRDALVSLGTERAYLTKGWRATLGARVVVSQNIVIKAEYLFNGEYGGVPFIPDNIFTSSAVFSF